MSTKDEAESKRLRLREQQARREADLARHRSQRDRARASRAQKKLDSLRTPTTPSPTSPAASSPAASSPKVRRGKKPKKGRKGKKPKKPRGRKRGGGLVGLFSSVGSTSAGSREQGGGGFLDGHLGDCFDEDEMDRGLEDVGAFRSSSGEKSVMSAEDLLHTAKSGSRAIGVGGGRKVKAEFGSRLMKITRVRFVCGIGGGGGGGGRSGGSGAQVSQRPQFLLVSVGRAGGQVAVFQVGDAEGNRSSGKKNQKNKKKNKKKTEIVVEEEEPEEEGIAAIDDLDPRQPSLDDFDLPDALGDADVADFDDMDMDDCKEIQELVLDASEAAVEAAVEEEFNYKLQHVRTFDCFQPAMHFFAELAVGEAAVPLQEGDSRASRADAGIADAVAKMAATAQKKKPKKGKARRRGGPQRVPVGYALFATPQAAVKLSFDVDRQAALRRMGHLFSNSVVETSDLGSCSCSFAKSESVVLGMEVSKNYLFVVGSRTVDVYMFPRVDRREDLWREMKDKGLDTLIEGDESEWGQDKAGSEARRRQVGDDASSFLREVEDRRFAKFYDEADGIFACARDVDVAAFPSKKKGCLSIVTFEDLRSGSLRATCKVTTIKAHRGPISQVAVSDDGALVATASNKGQVIRVWMTATGKQMKQIRRGLARAVVSSLDIAPSLQKLSVYSSTGRLQVFSLASIFGAQEDAVTQVFQVYSKGILSHGADRAAAYFSRHNRENDTVVYVATLRGEVFHLLFEPGSRPRLVGKTNLYAAMEENVSVTHIA